MIEELRAILELLGDVSQIGGWVLGGWLTFKAIILLSTTGAIVYCIKIGVEALQGMIHSHITAGVTKHSTPEATTVAEVEIKGMCITMDGTYEDVIDTLKQVRTHVNTAGGRYLHEDGARWLREAVHAKIQQETTQA